jgi:prepilin peptidase CpaA
MPADLVPPTAAATAVLATLLLAAVAVDVRSRRVPNKLVLTGIALAACGHALTLAQGAAPLAGVAWWSPLAGLAAGGAALMPLYVLRACGAGDVKLMAMVGAFVGPGTALTAVVYTLAAGGLLSLAFMTGRGVAAKAIENIRFILVDWSMRLRGGGGLALSPLANTAARLPYAVSIALGTAAALIWPLSS